MPVVARRKKGGVEARKQRKGSIKPRNKASSLGKKSVNVAKRKKKNTARPQLRSRSSSSKVI